MLWIIFGGKLNFPQIKKSKLFVEMPESALIVNIAIFKQKYTL